MTSKTPLITVVEGDNIGNITELDDLPLKREYEKLPSSFGTHTFSNLVTASASEAESDLSESESDENLDFLEDDNLNPPSNKKLDDVNEGIDPNDTLEEAESKESSKKETKFRSRPSACVFVASLAASLTDDELSVSVTNHFQKWGELALVKVLRDTSNRPYAFVQYTSDEAAKVALSEGQHSVLDGRTIRCEPAKVNRTLYVATADGKDASIHDVKEVLEQFGETEQLTGNNDSSFSKSNLNKAWFCKFAYRDDAIRAYANLRLSPEWIVEWAQNIEGPTEVFEKQEPEVVIDRFSVFVGQLSSQVTKEKLNERFSNHGKVSDIVLVLRPGNNFAFIKFVSEKAAAAAVERENHAVFLEKTMHVQYREVHHKKNKYSNSTSPRLNLAPPPVNLPYRRSSTGSGYGFSTAEPYRQYSSYNSYQGCQRRSSGKYHLSPRSVSLSGDRVQLRFHSPVYNNDIIDGPASFETGDLTKHTPISSPNNNTANSSHGELKSVYSSSTVSGSENDASTNPTTSGYGTSKFSRQRRSLSHTVVPQNMPPLIQRPPSSYCYYPIPKENFMFDQSSYVPYTYYPYYYPDSSLVDFSESAVGSAGPQQLAPYYMYYKPSPNPGGDVQIDALEEQQFPDTEMHY